jgi:dolichol-phosphate mannosyltransferase
MSKTETGNITLSMICPCYNEAEVIGMFYDELTKVLDSLEGVKHEIIFIDDGSTDGTLSLLNNIAEKDSRVRVCSLSRNFGHQIALTAGLDFAGGDAVLMMDTDLQHPPELIPRMIEKWRSGCDIVSAMRIDTENVSWIKNLTSRGFYSMINKLSRTQIPDGVADFTLLSKEFYGVLRGMRERHRFIRGMISWMGFNRGIVEYKARERAAGKTKYTFFRMMSMAFDAVLSFSSTPLLIATQIGIVVTIMGFLYLAWILLRALVLNDLVAGWPSLIAVTMILGGCQLLFIGLIGQYIARIFDETKGRPLYVVKQSPSLRPGADEEAPPRDALPR